MLSFPRRAITEGQFFLYALGMTCKLCTKHGKRPKSKRSGWVDGNRFFREDKIRKHAVAILHKEAMEQEQNLRSSTGDGGLTASIEARECIARPTHKLPVLIF